MPATKKQLGGVATLISIDRRARRPIYQQIYEAFRERIVNRELRPGQAVPSTRQMARELRVSRFPVLNAYAQLLAEGYFESRVGSGTCVATSLPVEPDLRRRRSAARPAASARTIAARAMALPPYLKTPWSEELGPFQVGHPELEAFPLKLWSKLAARHSRNMRPSDLRYGDVMGSEALREVIAVYLRTSRGVRCEADQIMIVSGSQQALDITTRVLLDPGAPVWIEEPGYWLVHHVLKAAGCRAVPVPVDQEGLDVSAGVALAPEARAAFVAPSHQYPLGVTMSLARRLQLLEWAAREGAWVLEDDYDSEYRYAGRPLAAMQGLDRGGRVIYLGTFSKVLFPALRLGYMVVPPDLASAFSNARGVLSRFSPTVDQAVLADFINEGHFARHIRRTRALYAARQAALVEAVRKELAGLLEVEPDEAGIHLVGWLAEGMDDRAASLAAERAGVDAQPLSSFTLEHRQPGGLILGYAGYDERRIREGVRRLAAALKQ